MKNALVIGSGFSGLSAACHLAKDGHKVTVLEKNASPGGRARQLEMSGFTFDMGPSWYWMPDVFEHFFEEFGHKVSDFYNLIRLSPSYKVFWQDDEWDMPSDYADLQQLFERTEPGSSQRLDDFMNEAAYKYQVGMKDFVYKPGLHFREFARYRIVRDATHLDLFKSVRTHIRNYFKNPKLVQLLEFPVLFLGAPASKTPALYSLMNYADMKLGTWYPQSGGMYRIVQAMYQVADELGVDFRFGEEAKKIHIKNNKAFSVSTSKETHSFDVVIGSADYHHIEQQLLPESYQSYSKHYWETRTMAPSCLLFYLGINKRLDALQHHNLFFDTSFDRHSHQIYETPEWPEHPLFYVCCPSKTDPTVAPEGSENLFILVPVASNLKGDTENLRQSYLKHILQRMEHRVHVPISDHISVQKSYSISDFKSDYHAFKGNAYGLANTLRQTAFLKPRIQSKKVDNLFYTGQLTVPGPGIPPSLISGEIVSRLVSSYLKKEIYEFR